MKMRDILNVFVESAGIDSGAFSYLCNHYRASSDSDLLREMWMGSCFDFSFVLEKMTDWPVKQFTWGKDARTIRIHRMNMSPHGFVDATGYTTCDTVMARYGDASGDRYRYRFVQDAEGEPSSDVNVAMLARFILAIPVLPFKTVAFRVRATKRMPELQDEGGHLTSV